MANRGKICGNQAISKKDIGKDSLGGEPFHSFDEEWQQLPTIWRVLGIA